MTACMSRHNRLTDCDDNVLLVSGKCSQEALISVAEASQPIEAAHIRLRSAMAAAASAAEGGELQGMYERKLRALTLEAATKRMLDPKLDSTWTQFVTVYLQHRDKVATEMTALISSFEPDAAM